jgi:hypothetical protein
LHAIEPQCEEVAGRSHASIRMFYAGFSDGFAGRIHASIRMLDAGLHASISFIGSVSGGDARAVHFRAARLSLSGQKARRLAHVFCLFLRDVLEGVMQSCIHQDVGCGMDFLMVCWKDSHCGLHASISFIGSVSGKRLGDAGRAFWCRTEGPGWSLGFMSALFLGNKAGKMRAVHFCAGPKVLMGQLPL